MSTKQLNKTTQNFQQKVIAKSNIEFDIPNQQKRIKIKLEHQIFSETPKAILLNKNTPLKGSTAKMRKSES